MKYLAVLLVLVVLSACTYTVQATPEQYAASYARVTAQAAIDAPALPTITPAVVPCIQVKGNIDARGRKLYHLPGMANYNQVVITESKGEKVFCSEQDAINAGWTKAGN